MSEAARIAPQLSGPAWIMAREQTAGRGRRGRGWQTQAENFAATYVLRPKGGPAEAALYSFVAALALDEAIARVAGPNVRLAIKWPNDVLLNGGKIAGILLESLGTGAAVAHLAIGIGVNLVHVPEGTALDPDALSPVSLLGETGIRVTADEFLPVLAQAFARHQAQFETYGFAPIRTAWLARAARIGQTVRARTGTQTHEGVFETIDDNGAMILQTPDGRRAITAAEVFF